MQIKSTVLAASLLIFLKIFKYKVENYLIKHIFQTIAPLPGCSYFGGGKQAMSALLAAVMIYLLIFFVHLAN